MGNPLTYFNGKMYAFTWKNGRQLATAYPGGNYNLSFEYNDEGIRTRKTVSGVVHDYILNGTQIVGEKIGSNLVLYLYDAEGAPIGMQYRKTSYAEGVFDTYWFEKNLQGDIIAVYDAAGTKLISYTYDAWGNSTVTYHNGGASTTATYNPFRYRGYYFDKEIGFYYLNSRYYDPVIGRFINADTTDVLTATPMDLTDKNLYAYCHNNPVNMYDPTGEFAVSITLGGIALWKVGVAMVGLVGAYILVDTIVENPPVLPPVSFPKNEITLKTETKAEAKAESIPASPPSLTVIYRYGGANPGNLTPKEKDKYSGLSFSTVRMPGAAMTTIEALNATGVVYAIQDGATHVSVRPVGATVEDWINAGSGSIWTQAVKSVIIK